MSGEGAGDEFVVQFPVAVLAHVQRLQEALANERDRLESSNAAAMAEQAELRARWDSASTSFFGT